MEKGIIIIVAVGIAITLVNLYFSHLTIKDIKAEYETMLDNRKIQNRDLLMKLSDISEKCAHLEAELAFTRHNKPLDEFIDVPRGKKEYRTEKVSF